MNKIKSHVLLMAAFVCIASAIRAQNVTTPRVSPSAETIQKIGLTTVSVKYSRPQVIVNGNDRTGQVWGGLVPYGFAEDPFARNAMPWRAGANENTVFTTSTEIMIEGQKLPAGEYGLHMAVYKDGKVSVIFSGNTSSWGSYHYDESEDVLRVDVQSEAHEFTNVLTYNFIEFEPNGATMVLDWENKRIPIKLSVDPEQTLVAFRNELRGMKGFSWQGWNSAANFCRINNINHEEAIMWADRSISIQKTFQNTATKAGLLLQKGDKAEAMKMLDASAELAIMNQLNMLGYMLMQQGEAEKAVEFFELNMKRNPEVANMYDSLGEGLRAMGDTKKAIKMFKKSLSMDPPENVKQNSIRNLKELGVEVQS